MLDQLARSSLHLDTEDIPIFGQETVLEQIEPFLEGDTPNILLLGPPGSGKTHLARWVAAQKQTMFTESMCPVEPHEAPITGIWLLDECHRQNRPEGVFKVMEDKAVTVVGTTTQPQKLDPAFRDRFFLRLYLEPLSMEARKEYITHHLGDMPEEHLIGLARASAGNPRQGERIMVASKALGTTDPSKVLASVRINADGLNDLHMKIMSALERVSRPVGLSTLALMVRSDEVTVSEHEVILVDLELLELSKSGRTLTNKGTRYVEALASQ